MNPPLAQIFFAALLVLIGLTFLLWSMAEDDDGMR